LYRVRGFINPTVPEDQVYRPDYVELADLYRKLAQTRTSPATNKEKQDALENFSEFVFDAIDGFSCSGRNVRVSDSEVDRIFSNRHTEHPLLQKLGSSLRIECKNTAKPVSTSELKTFVDVLRQAQAPYGVYVSMAGFSGIRTMAKRPVALKDCAIKARDAFGQGHCVLMFDADMIEAIGLQGHSLITALWHAREFVENL
jgi:hypothetical protein